MEATSKKTQADSGSDREGEDEEGAVGGVVERVVTQEVHFHIKGNVYHGDVVWTKADVKDSAIESIGAGPPNTGAQLLPEVASAENLAALQCSSEASTGVAGGGSNDTVTGAFVGLRSAEGTKPTLTELQERLTAFALTESRQPTEQTRPKTVGLSLTGSNLFAAASPSHVPEIEDDILSSITSLAEEAAEKYVGRHLPLKLVKTYEDEDRKISMNFLAKYQDLLLPLQQIWARVKREASIAALGRHVANMSPDVAESSSASLCYEITKRHSSSEDEDEDFLLPYHSRVQDVFKMGKDFATDSLYVHAVVSFYFCAKLHRVNSKGEDSVDGMLSCVHKIRQAIRSAEEEESTNPFPEWAMGFRESTNLIVQDCLSSLLEEISPVSQQDASSPD